MDALAPSFTCARCGRPVGSHRKDDGPWEPGACHWCVYLPKARKDVALRRALGHVVAGVDLDKALAAYSKMPPFRGNLGGKVKLVVSHRMERGTRGLAYITRRKIRISAGPDATPEMVLDTLVHEMAHLAVPRGVGHGERFRLVLKRAFSTLWDIDVPLDVPSFNGCIAYGMDEIATAALKEKIAQGEVELFPPDPKPENQKPARAARAAELVEKRQAHTLKMLSRAEARAKSAQRTLAKWRKKAAYYERQAAKRSKGAS